MPHVSRDGVKLYYEESGSGDRPFVFVHGWCCNHTHFAPQMAHFGAQHRVITVDLRGHGDSDVPGDGYTIPGFADDVAWMCEQLGVVKPVIVGHSMGGAVTLSLAARHADVPAAIVMLDGAIMWPDALKVLAKQLTVAFHSPGYLAPLTGIVDGMFMATDDPARRAQITKSMLATPQHVMAAAFDSVLANDSEADARGCAVPALYVGSYAPVADVARLHEVMPAAMIAQTAGAGHFHQLEVPEQINAMIERFLKTSLPSV